MTSARSPVEAHREQGTAWSCIAACVSMVGEWRSPGRGVTEAALLAGWAEPKTSWDHAAAAGELRFWDPTEPTTFERLRVAVRVGWVIVRLFPGPLLHFTRQRSPVPVSKHGDLLPYAAARTARGLPHAVVLVEAPRDDCFCYLDPYYPSTAQPFSLTEDELAEAWTGNLVIPR